jgi:hypothetical protein
MLIETVQVDTTGSAGSATGNNTSARIRGLFYKITLDYNGSAPATTDVTITTIDDDSNTIDTILTISDNNTDGTYSPVTPTHDSTGTATGDNILQNIPLGKVKISVAQCDALTNAVTATIHYIPLGNVASKGT